MSNNDLNIDFEEILIEKNIRLAMLVSIILKIVNIKRSNDYRKHIIREILMRRSE